MTLADASCSTVLAYAAGFAESLVCAAGSAFLAYAAPIDALWRLATLQDYNTRVVLLGATLLGVAAGAVGSLTLLRRRSLMGDALSHATLPGIALAFMVGISLGGSGKSLPLLLLGASVTGLLGVAAILAIHNLTRIKEDAALGIVLSVFFGLGIVLLTMVQQMESGHAAGLKSFIYGKTAAMLVGDAWLIGAAAAATLLGLAALFKEFKLLCFDEAYAGARGMPTLALDVILMALVVVITIVGLQAVGLILMIALLVIPAAAARFWTERMTRMTVIAAALGGLAGAVGSAISAVAPDAPSGPMIVLVATVCFVVSMVFGTARGVAWRALRRRRLSRRIDRRHLLRGLYELGEASAPRRATSQAERPWPAATRRRLLRLRSWAPRRLGAVIRRVAREGLCTTDEDRVTLTERGYKAAARLVHEHRLWELYLITHADIAPGAVDRDADAIEHVLEREMIEELERLLRQRQAVEGIAASPHPVAT